MKQLKQGKYRFKNEKLVVSNKSTPKGNTLTIKRYQTRKKAPVYLADVFIETPSGFILKDETGMGATYLELEADRNSIIVEPIKITASSKAYNHGALYVGSGTKYHPEKTTSKEQIKSYLANEQIPKKIVVVADSLYKVIDAIGPNIYSDYFLLIDEIDSFQLDSTYRKSMEITLDHYKLFGPNNRAMLSATGIDFTDPILSLEPTTFIKYDKPKARNISVITTNKQNLLGVCIDVLERILIENPKDKIFVAFNSIQGSVNLANHFVQTGQLPQEEIKILCSSASSKYVVGYYHELDSDILPGRINFLTSAYFTGFDLKESYHLVSISGNISEVHALSERRLKQIAGRCRTGLLSETVIHDLYDSKKDKVDPTRDSLIEAASIQADAMACNKKHYSKSSVLMEILHEINARMLTFLEDKNLRFVREDKDGHIVTSYLNIDAHLMSIKVRNVLYKTRTALRDKLKTLGNSVTHKVMYSETIVEKSDSNFNDRNTQVEDIIESLSNCDSEAMIMNILRDGKLSSLQRTVANEFLKVHSYVDSKIMLDLMKEKLINSRDSRSFNLLMQSAVFHIQPEGHIAVDRLNYYFPFEQNKDASSPKQRFTKADILQRMRIYLAELGNPAQNVTEAKAIRLLNHLRKVNRDTDPKTQVAYHIVSGSNPLKIPVVRTKPLPSGDSRFTLLF